ncbi:MAG TPA: prepilin-type N-terminal cleavage/methylation domain-containing protein [Myxococcales bacterium]|jgi:prepilin-type N-terminal cleavage/methylation domain-containing protein
MRRGFTLLELAICISIGTLLIPMVLALGRVSEKQHLRALAEVDATQVMRTASEELRRDLQTLRMADGTTVTLQGACGRVEYVAEGGVLARKAEEACGGTRALGRRVRAIRRDGARALVVEFERPVEPGNPAVNTFRFAW